MFKTLLINAIVTAIRTYVGSGIFDRISALVSDLIKVDIPGDDKRKIVRTAIRVEYKAISTIIVDTVIQIVLLKFLMPDVFKKMSN